MASILNIEGRSEGSRGGLWEYRAARRRTEEKKARSSARPRNEKHQPKAGGGLKDQYDEWLKQDMKQKKKKGLIPSTILEEDDSSENGF